MKHYVLLLLATTCLINTSHAMHGAEPDVQRTTPSTLRKIARFGGGLAMGATAVGLATLAASYGQTCYREGIFDDWKNDGISSLACMASSILCTAKSVQMLDLSLKDVGQLTGSAMLGGTSFVLACGGASFSHTFTYPVGQSTWKGATFFVGSIACAVQSIKWLSPLKNKITNLYQ